jgi:NADH-ubiquinone oxidoreductase chain 5
MMVIGSLALIGFPFLTGFYSKDVILEIAFGKYTLEGHFSYILGSVGAFLTAFYSTRLLYLTFLSSPNGHRAIISTAYDSSYQITISLFLLGIPSVLMGFYTKDMIIGFGSDF